MILFLLKGLIRDPSRSVFPVITVTVGVMLTVVLQSWISGLQGELVRSSARFTTGHVKVMTRAYARRRTSYRTTSLCLVSTHSLDRSGISSRTCSGLLESGSEGCSTSRTQAARHAPRAPWPVSPWT